MKEEDSVGYQFSNRCIEDMSIYNQRRRALLKLQAFLVEDAVELLYFILHRFDILCQLARNKS